MPITKPLSPRRRAALIQTRAPFRQDRGQLRPFEFPLQPPFHHNTTLCVSNGAPGVGKGRVYLEKKLRGLGPSKGGADLTFKIKQKRAQRTARVQSQHESQAAMKVTTMKKLPKKKKRPCQASMRRNSRARHRLLRKAFHCPQGSVASVRLSRAVLRCYLFLSIWVATTKIFSRRPLEFAFCSRTRRVWGHAAGCTLSTLSWTAA